MIRAGVTSSAVLLFFGFSAPFSLPCEMGASLTKQEGWSNQQVSLPCPVLVLSRLATAWNFHAGKGCREPAPQSLLGYSQ